MARRGRRRKRDRASQGTLPPAGAPRTWRRVRDAYEHARAYWTVFGVLCALLAGIGAVRMVLAEPRLVYSGDFDYYPEPPDSSVAVTPPFELTGRPSSVEVAVSTDVDNTWVYFNYALIELRTGRAIEFGREVGYFYGSGTVEGRDVRGRPIGPAEYSWTEGSRKDVARVPTVPAGRYVLRIEPEGPSAVRYRVTVRRDVPGLEFFAMALLLLLVVPVLASLDRDRGEGAPDPGRPRQG